MLEKFSQWKKGKEKKVVDSSQLKQQNIPKHVAIIMDGNGRWAKKRGLPRIAGHKQGMDVVRTITKVANNIGVEVLTLYAFSTENWKRPKNEVDFLMHLPKQFLTVYLPELIEENVQVRMMGHREQLPSYTKEAIDEATAKTAQNTGLVLNFALNYGSRDEMTVAIQNIAEDVKNGKLSIEDINDTLISNYLMTQSLPDPDLLIRTSGELRISNFLLWQIAYTELYFTDVYWPDFNEARFMEAIEAYYRRTRRYGGV